MVTENSTKINQNINNKYNTLVKTINEENFKINPDTIKKQQKNPPKNKKQNKTKKKLRRNWKLQNSGNDNKK